MSPNPIDWYPYKKRKSEKQTHKDHVGNTARMWPSATKEISSGETNLTNTLISDSQPPEAENINGSCLSRQVCSVPLRWLN